MRILTIEDRPGAGAGDARRLRALGHTISRCHGVTDRPFPCRTLTGSCPLEGPDGIDLVVDSRAGASLDASASEAGGVCALRRDVPVLVRGAVDPFPGWSVVQRNEESLESACERAFEVHATEQARSLEAEAARLLAVHDPDAPRPSVHVARTGQRTSIVVELASPASPALRGTLATRVHAVYRARTQADAIVDVSVCTPEPTGTTSDHDVTSGHPATCEARK